MSQNGHSRIPRKTEVLDLPGTQPQLVGQVLEHLGDQRGDRRALAARQGHVGKERVSFEGLNDCDDAIVAANPQVVALGDIVGQDNAR